MTALEKIKNVPVILASGSPRRKEILSNLGIDFKVIKSMLDEVTEKTIPTEVVEDLALQKASNVAKQVVDQNSLIIGCDTVVSVDGIIFGKPKDYEDAKHMFHKMIGRKHQVVSGLCLIYKGHICLSHEVTDVEFADMTEEEINEYLATGEYKDKAGGYGIQGLAAPYIRGICGDYYNVVGFPVRRFIEQADKLID